MPAPEQMTYPATGNAARGNGPAARLPFTTDEFRSELARSRRSRRRRIVLAVVACVVAACVAAAVLVLKVPGSLRAVTSDDMSPALQQGQVVLTREAGDLSAGEVVAFRDSAGDVQFKRVIAVAGEWVNVASDGTVVVSAVPLEGNSAAGVINGSATIVASRQVPEGSCFAMADAAAGTTDVLSRPENFIAKDQVVGIAWFRVWPIVNLGAVQ